MDITEEQKQTLQGITIHNGTNAWEHKNRRFKASPSTMVPMLGNM